MARFRVYYGDGSTCEGSTDNDAWYAPATDVQVIVQVNPDKAEGVSRVFGKSLHGYYCWREGHWFITDEAGYQDYMMCIPGPKKVLYGRSILRTKVFEAVLQRAKAEGLGNGQVSPD